MSKPHASKTSSGPSKKSSAAVPVDDAGRPIPTTDAEAELARKIEQLTPEQQEMFVRALHLAMRKRRVLLVGYAATAVSLVLGWLWALYIFGKTRGSGEFMAWVFLVPPALAAIVLVTFGRFSRGLRD